MIWICCFFIYFVNCNNNWYFCCFCMVNCFNCLRYYIIVCCNNKDCNICYLCIVSMYCCKCSMFWCIKECNFFFINYNLISIDMLCDIVCFCSCYFCVMDRVKKCCFIVVNVIYDCNNWRMYLKIFFVINDF